MACCQSLFIYFAAFNGQAAFAACITTLVNAGCDGESTNRSKNVFLFSSHVHAVIVDDVGYFNEAWYQDDDVARAADAAFAVSAMRARDSPLETELCSRRCVCEAGVPYFSSAGNANDPRGAFEAQFNGAVFDPPGSTFVSSKVH